MMTKRFMAIMACMMLASCGKSLPEGGYGDIRYGMTEAELMAQGFACSSSECERDDVAAIGDGPKFGTVARASAQLANGRVNSFDLMSLTYNEDEMVELYQDAYGSPEICRFNNALGANVEKLVWTAGDGSTATISKILDYGAAIDMSGLSGRSSSIVYRDAQESSRFKSVSC
ncbi:hypothetical protein K7H13_03445 [Qipengyuania citrea]|uniref:hypothetical protein n=1 Tax=Qipengyuania citrea TaxID=225971 RepID=UPI001E303A49|nr:hypothetical protein [Qipengyuania citrea]MCD1589817.1 hypothetical protein [Qipengyuania citrea]